MPKEQGYRLEINGFVMGDFLGAHLEKGVDIQVADDNSGHSAAKSNRKLNEIRHEYEQQLRSIRFSEYGPRREGIDISDIEAARVYFNKKNRLESPQ